MSKLTWSQVRKKYPQAYDAFEQVIDGCSCDSDDDPQRSDWAPETDDEGRLHAVCEDQPVASVVWYRGKWVEGSMYWDPKAKRWRLEAEDNS
jgi:hypothetical protein